jgi:hypothetical protein
MITFFTTAKPFLGHDGLIQRNALQSWKFIHPGVEIVLFGDEAGVPEVCAEYGLRHEPDVQRNGKIPYVNFMFVRAQEIAKNDYLCYANCDIVLFKDLWTAFEKALAWRRRFLLIAQRWDTEVKERIDFCDPDWSGRLRQLARTTGSPQIPDYIDFFLFPRGLFDDIPPLVVGRAYWDHWMVWKALSVGAAVLDASLYLTPVHQNHGYAHHPQGHGGILDDVLARQNFELGEKGKHLRSMHDATHAMTRNGRILPTPLRRPLSRLYAMRNKQGFLENTFPLRKWLGLRREPLRRIQRQIAEWFGIKN